MRRVLVTGGGGFVGQWLARALLARGDDVTLSGLGAELSGPDVLTQSERRASRWVNADMRDQGAVERAIDDSRPDAIVHLAGVSFPPQAERDPMVTHEVNVLATLRMLISIGERRLAGMLDPVVLVVGSGAQYGRHEASEMPLLETASLQPTGVYASSKADQEQAALQVHQDAGVKVVCTRSFNHSGAGQVGDYLIPSLVARALRVRVGGEPTLKLGNDVVRDYLHVDDVVRAYLGLLERGTPGEVYNVASGRGVSVRQLASDVLLRVGATADISTDVALQRATDIPVLVGSHAKLTKDTGWAPEKTHLDIIDDVIRFASTHAATD